MPSPCACCSRIALAVLARAPKSRVRVSTTDAVSSVRARVRSLGFILGSAFNSESGKLRMRHFPVMHVHASHLGAAVQSGHALARIEQALRVEGFLDAMEARELLAAELVAHGVELLDTDAVLTGDRAADVDAQLQDAV